MKFFNFKKDDIGVEFAEDTTPNLKFYFKSLWRKLAKLISINLLAILQFAPLLAAFLVRFWADTTPTITNAMFPVLQGVADFGTATPADFSLFSATALQYHAPYFSVWTIVILALLVIFFALTFGLWNVGLTYLMREMVTGNPVFIFADMKHAIKRNFKQGILVGIIDFVVIAIFYIDFTSMDLLPMSFFGDFMYIAIIAIAIIYFIMRFYIYLMLVTFDMKIRKIFKNAFIFVVLGIKRNLLAILWTVVLLGLNVALIFTYLPLGIILPILYLPIIPMFTTAYAAYPIIQKYMIDPVQPAGE